MITDEDEENPDQEKKKKKANTGGPTARLDKILENLQELKSIYKNRKEIRSSAKHGGSPDVTF